MRVAVTGASGFCGSALVYRLHTAGHQVVALDRYAPIESLPVEAFFQGDLLDRDALNRTLAGVDAVVHMAALPAIARTSTADYERVNHQGTQRVIEVAVAHGVQRMVHVSSSTVYGAPSQQPIPEDAPLQPACDYSRSKVAAETRCVELADQHGLQIAIIRPRVVVGPGRAGVFSLLFAFVRRGWPVPLPGGAHHRFQFTAVEDLASACVAALDPQRSWSGARAFNVGAPVEGCLRDDLARLIEHAESSSRFLSLPAAPARGGGQGVAGATVFSRASPAPGASAEAAPVDMRKPLATTLPIRGPRAEATPARRRPC